MGFIPESSLKSDPQVYGAISKLKPGQFTEVLSATPNSGPYAIYKLISRDPAGQRLLSDPRIQQAIHTQLHNNRAQLLQNAYYEVLQNDAKVDNYLAKQILEQGAK
jgi:peptidyl-prolyl cis-trans isomerase SurA